MHPLLKFLEPATIELNLQADNEWDAIRCVTGLLRNSALVVNFDTLCKEVIAREEVCSTASSSGVAFPHARTNAVRQIVLAIGRSESGVLFRECGHLVHFVVVIGTPKEMVREYLNLVGELARLFKNRPLREQLMRTATPSEFRARLTGANAT